MDFLRRVIATIRHFESRYPGAIFLAFVIIFLAVSDLFLKSSIHEYRYIWYRLYEGGGKNLFYLFGGSTEIDIENFYDPPTWILSIKHQLASVLAMYVLTTNIAWKRITNAISWFIIIQFLGMIKFALMIRIAIQNPESPFLISEQPMHLVLWLAPFTAGILNNNLKLNNLWRQDGVHPLGSFPLLISRILAILIIVSGFRIIDQAFTWILFEGTRLTLWEAGAGAFNELMRWPVLHGSKVLLNQFMYKVSVNEHTVTNGISTIYLGAPCLGKGVLIVFSIIIILTNTAWEHKFKCIVLGFFTLILFNILRMSLLFSFVYEFGSGSYNYQTWHDIYSGIIYLAIIGLWWRCTR